MSDVRYSSAYLVLKRAQWHYDPPVVAAMRKEKPALKSGEIAVKVTIAVDMSLFDEYIPEVVVDLERGAIIEPEAELEDAEPVATSSGIATEGDRA